MNPKPATEMHLLSLGDIWHYAVSGTLTTPAGTQLPVQGEIVVQICPDALAGRNDAMSIRFAQSLSSISTDGTPTSLPGPVLLFSFVQNQATRDVAIFADNMTPTGIPRIAQQSQVFYPGIWSATTGYANVLDFGGQTVANTLVTHGPEWVDVPMGRHAAWSCSISSESAATGRIEGRDWWSPELGAPIQFEVISPTPDGGCLQFLAGMTATSVS